MDGLDCNGFLVLDRDVCLELLATTALGRIAFPRDGSPSILPVNFRVVDDEIVFGTGHDGALASLPAGTMVAFEVDHFDGLYRAGWSVIVHGRLRPATSEAASAALRSLPFSRWSPRPAETTMVIEPTTVSGRKLVPGSSAGSEQDAPSEPGR